MPGDSSNIKTEENNNGSQGFLLSGLNSIWRKLWAISNMQIKLYGPFTSSNESL